MVSVTFGHLYGADPTRMSTEGLLLAVPTLWDRYFGFGSVEVGVPEDRRMEMTVMHQADLGADDLIAGFFERIAELTGVSDARVTVTAGLENTRFLVEWTP
jgi:hypothetical protein